MQEMVAYCGLVCTECPTYKATQRNDDEARAKIAEEWSKQFQDNVRIEDINCMGCLAVADVQVDYCSVCHKKLIGRGTKYKDPEGSGYLCREHAKKRGIRVFRPFHGWIPVKSKIK